MTESLNKIRIALAQISPVSAPLGPPALEKPHTTTPFPSLDVNLNQVVRMVETAALAGGDVVVFPEYFLQGLVNESRQYLTFPSIQLMTFLRNLAKLHRISIVGTIVHGTVPESAHDIPFPKASPFEHIPLFSSPLPAAFNGITSAQLEWANYLQKYPESVAENSKPTLKNTAFFIDDSGEILGQFVKKNLWHPERDYITAGDEDHQVFQTKWGKVGLLICWDVSHPASAQAISDQGADIVFAPTYWLSTDSDPLIQKHPYPRTYETQLVSSLSFARAFETETIWVMCNAGGDVEEGFMGGSGVWAPFLGRVGGWDVATLGLGEGIGKGNGAAEVGVKIVEVDLGVLKDARATYKIREDWARTQAS